MRRTWIIGIAVVGVLVAGVTIVRWLTVPESHLAVVKDFYDDFAFTYSDPSLAGARYAERFEDHALAVRETNRQWSTSVENDVAMVEGRFTGKDDVEVTSATFWLTREDKVWSIVAFEIEDQHGEFAGGTIPGSD